MRKLIRGFRKGEKGFTLIELLVVIAILGIIAAIVVPNFGNFFGRGQDEANEIELRMVKTAVIAYASQEGSCPADTAAIAEYFDGDLTCDYEIDDEYPDCTVTQDCGDD
ncbi:MAG: prepilin-type N-terminal cleavage/methylation domain-containing protein [Dehalococcoidia bacterium]|jgi:type IV pilus assembly protein PilA